MAFGVVVVGCAGGEKLSPDPAVVAAVEISALSVSIGVGATVQLGATPVDIAGTPISGRTITWSSANPAVVAVSASGLATGVRAGGPVTVSANCEGQAGSSQVTVVAAVATVSVAPSSAGIIVGASTQLTATVRDNDFNVLTDRQVAWLSSNSAIASVSSSGKVTGVAAGGPVTITASSEGKTGTSQITVTNLPPVFTVVVNPSPSFMMVGAGRPFSTTLRGSSGATLSERPVVWNTSDPAVVTVSPSGLVSGVSPGVATITATSEGITGIGVVTVSASLGQTIVFYRYTGSLGAANTEVWRMKPDGSAALQLTNNAVFDGTPDLSPDATQIVFASDRAGSTDLYIMGVDGSSPRALPAYTLFVEAWPVWSPDGKTILYTRFDGGLQIEHVGADGQGRGFEFVDGDCLSFPTWSPDATTFLYAAFVTGLCTGAVPIKRIFRAGPPVLLSGGGTGVTRTRTQLTFGPGDDLDPDWCTNGSRIAFASSRTGSYQVYAMNSDGTGVIQLTSAGSNYAPSWSPDCSRIAFTSTRTGLEDIWVMNADGTGQINITNTPALKEDRAKWR
jgi:uncharacterized protein YjdB